MAARSSRRWPFSSRPCSFHCQTASCKHSQIHSHIASQPASPGLSYHNISPAHTCWTLDGSSSGESRRMSQFKSSKLKSLRFRCTLVVISSGTRHKRGFDQGCSCAPLLSFHRQLCYVLGAALDRQSFLSLHVPLQFPSWFSVSKIQLSLSQLVSGAAYLLAASQNNELLIYGSETKVSPALSFMICRAATRHSTISFSSTLPSYLAKGGADLYG